MANVKETRLKFPPSNSPDVVGYRLYMAEDPAPVSYDSDSWELGNETDIDLASLDEMTTKDGIFNFGVVAIDDAGNESSMSILEGIALDFVAPDPPGLIELIRS